MTLIKCKECNKDISDTALKCPHCGIQLVKQQRSVFGKICKWIFFLFNAFMVYSCTVGMNNASHLNDGTLTGAEKTGHNIGMILGLMSILFIWVAGGIILGLLVLFTKPSNN